MNLFNSAEGFPRGDSPLIGSLHNVQDNYQHPASHYLSQDDSPFPPNPIPSPSAEMPEEVPPAHVPDVPHTPHTTYVRSGPDYVLFILTLMAFLTFLRAYVKS